MSHQDSSFKDLEDNLQPHHSYDLDLKAPSPPSHLLWAEYSSWFYCEAVDHFQEARERHLWKGPLKGY